MARGLAERDQDFAGFRAFNTAVPTHDNDLARMADIAPTVADAAALVAIDGTNVTNMRRWVTTYRCPFRFDPITSRTPIADVVLAGIGGNWVREQFTDPSLLAQTTWYWSPAAAGNEADGATSGTPIKDHEEIYRRTRGLDFGTASVVIVVMGNVPLQQVRIGFRAALVYYEANLVSLGTGTLTSGIVTQNKATGTAWALEDTSLPASWTASGYVNKLLIAKSGASVTATAFVDKDLGSKKCRAVSVSNRDTIAVPAVPSFTTPSAGTPASGNTYAVYDFLTFAPTQIHSDDPDVRIVCYGLRFTGSFSEYGFNIFAAIHCVFDGTLPAIYLRVVLIQCLFNGSVIWNAASSAALSFSTFKGSLQITSGIDWECISEISFTNGGLLFFTHCSKARGAADIALFDVTAIGIQISHLSRIATGLVWGSNNTGSLVTISGVGSRWYPNTAPLATTSGTELSIAGDTHTFAELIADGSINYLSKDCGATLGTT